MTATQNFTTTVTALFNQMTMPIASGQIYNIRGVLNYTLDNGNSNGITIGLQFPAARRANFQAGFTAAAVLGPALTNVAMAGTTSGVGTNLAVITSGTNAMRGIFIDGTLLCSGSGHLIFFGAAEVANSTAKVLDGSHLIAWNVMPLAI